MWTEFSWFRVGLSEEIFLGGRNSNAPSDLRRSMDYLDQLRKYKLFQKKKYCPI
jgi:hypothetical protein